MSLCRDTGGGDDSDVKAMTKVEEDGVVTDMVVIAAATAAIDRNFGLYCIFISCLLFPMLDLLIGSDQILFHQSVIKVMLYLFFRCFAFL